MKFRVTTFGGVHLHFSLETNHNSSAISKEIERLGGTADFEKRKLKVPTEENMHELESFLQSDCELN